MGKIQMKSTELFEENRTLAWPCFLAVENPWELIPRIKEIILAIGQGLDPALYKNPSEGIWIAKSASVAPTAAIGAPAIIGENTVIRKGAHVGAAPDGSDGWGVATCGPDIEIREGATVAANAMIYKSEEV